MTNVNIYAPNAEDTVDINELYLYNDLQTYRASVGLPAIPLSKALSTTAARHDVDIAENLGQAVPDLTLGEHRAHSWSDAGYNAKDPSTYGAIWNAPQRLGTGYTGYGFEILATGTGSVVRSTPEQTAAVLLNAWKMSTGHNAVMVNQGPWADSPWGAVGVGVYKNSAAIWFGRETDPTGAPQIIGTAAADRAPLTAFADTVLAIDGNDTVIALGGDDVVYGNAGNDLIFGNAGNDVLYGGKDADTLYGGQGFDQLLGNVGDDLLLGNLGNDTLSGGQGSDTLYGGQGDDRLYGDIGNDVLTGDFGADIFAFGPGSGQDTITDFNPSDGDRISLAPGVAWNAGAIPDGGVLLTFGGDTVRLQGVSTFDQSWLITA